MSIRKVALISVVALLVCIAIGFIYVNFLKPKSGNGLDKNTAAIVGNHKITFAELKIATDQSNIPQSETLDCLMDGYLYQDLASRLAVDVSAAKKEDETLCNYRNNLEKALKIVFAGKFKGSLVITNFDQNIASAEREDTSNPAQGRSERYEADKAAAKNLIDSLYAKVKAGSLTIEQAAQIERNDPKIGEKILFSNIHSGNFDTTSDTEGNLYYAQLFNDKLLQKAASAVPLNQLSDIVTLSILDANNKQVESKYVFFQLSASKMGKNNSFDDEVAKQKLNGYKRAKL